MMVKMTTIQLRQNTKKRIEKRKKHPRESYDSVISRMLEEDIPSMEEVFAECDKIKQDKTYSTEEIIKMSHELRRRR